MERSDRVIDMENKQRMPLYSIGIAARLAGMHPQTLRIYERKRLVVPMRSGGQTRLYSEDDIEQIRFIQDLTQRSGINLAGVERVMELKREIKQLETIKEEMENKIKEIQKKMVDEINTIHRSYKNEIMLFPRGTIVKKIV